MSKILIIEDEEKIARFVELELSHEGYETDKATNGREGLEKIDAAYERGDFTYLFTTNLIYRSDELKKRKWYVEVNLCKYVALLINTLNHDKSISGLLSNAEKITNLQKAHQKKHSGD